MPAGSTSRRPSLKGNSPESIRFRSQVSSNIARFASARNKSRLEVARLAGLSESRMSDINQATTTLSGLELTMIARALDVSVDQLVSGCLEGP